MWKIAKQIVPTTLYVRRNAYSLRWRKKLQNMHLSIDCLVAKLFGPTLSLSLSLWPLRVKIIWYAIQFHLWLGKFGDTINQKRIRCSQNKKEKKEKRKKIKLLFIRNSMLWFSMNDKKLHREGDQRGK